MKSTKNNALRQQRAQGKYMEPCAHFTIGVLASICCGLTTQECVISKCETDAARFSQFQEKGPRWSRNQLYRNKQRESSLRVHHLPPYLPACLPGGRGDSSSKRNHIWLRLNQPPSSGPSFSLSDGPTIDLGFLRNNPTHLEFFRNCTPCEVVLRPPARSSPAAAPW